MAEIKQWMYQVWDRMTPTEQQRIKDKCNWEKMTRFAVMREWPSLIPERLLNFIPKRDR
ncbi:MAG: hypothetical protein AB7L09_03275 [Nitrospira sp.]